MRGKKVREEKKTVALFDSHKSIDDRSSKITSFYSPTTKDGERNFVNKNFKRNLLWLIESVCNQGAAGNQGGALLRPFGIPRYVYDLFRKNIIGV